MRKIAPTEIFFGHKYVCQQSVTAVKKVKVHIQKNGPCQCFVFFLFFNVSFWFETAEESAYPVAAKYCFMWKIKPSDLIIIVNLIFTENEFIYNKGLKIIQRIVFSLLFICNPHKYRANAVFISLMRW